MTRVKYIINKNVCSRKLLLCFMSITWMYSKAFASFISHIHWAYSTNTVGRSGNMDNIDCYQTIPEYII